VPAILAAAALLAARSWFSRIGEPFADDFDFLDHASRSGPGGWLDGGGSSFYWRPLARQLYYRSLGGLMISHPGWIAAFQALCLALTALLLYRTLRRRGFAGIGAAAAAAFPLLIEASRSLVAWPTMFQDLGAMLFSALAIHEASRSRLATALASLLAALLCKEVAVVTVLLLPWMPGPVGVPPARQTRLRWALAAAGLVAIWGAAYALVMRHAGLLLARDAVGDPRVLAVGWSHRFMWALGQTARDAGNLPGLPATWLAVPRLFLTGLLGATTVAVAASPSARARLRAASPWVLWGLAWFALSTATLADVYPDWRPYRSPFGAMGLGVACAALLGAGHPALVGIAAAVQVATLLLVPGPPATIASFATGSYSIDFPRLVRLQRLVGETRARLTTLRPPPSPGLRAARHFYPPAAMFAFDGDRSLAAWYRDTTVRWMTVEAAEASGQDSMVILEFQAPPARQLALVDLAAVRHLERTVGLIEGRDWNTALIEVARAESLQRDPGAIVFSSLAAAKRALALYGLGRDRESVAEAQRALALWDLNQDARYVLAAYWLKTGNATAAETTLATLVRMNPRDEALRRLLAQARRARSPWLPSGPGATR
jgi:tetratricopeptide (TPR) repeat protein